MRRPVILTEAQLRAAVAVAEVQREHGRRILAASKLTNGTPEYVAAISEIVNLYDVQGKALADWEAIRPDAPFEVRAGETLARIVAEKTDGGTECRARDGLLSEVLREFEGREVRDGAR